MVSGSHYLYDAYETANSLKVFDLVLDSINKQLDKLKKLDKFKFTKHPRYNLLEERLEYLNILIDYCIKELMSLF